MNNFLTIKEAVQSYIDSAQGKINTTTLKLIAKAILAGFMIGMGAAGSSVVAHSIDNVGVAKLAASIVFPVGLMMVILLGAELFTGDCLLVMGTAAGKSPLRKVARVLTLVFIGNFIGAALMAFMTFASGQFDYSGGLLGAYSIKVALGKVNLSAGSALISGILCNMLVCAAVLMAMCAKDVTGKLLASFFTIMLFVTEGFEHCVANMYFIVAGMIARINPEYVTVAMNQYGYTAEELSALNIQGLLINNLLQIGRAHV